MTEQERITRIADINNALHELGLDNLTKDIVTKYDEPHRFYHNMNHIFDLIKKWKESGQYNGSVEIFLAILFHDIVYHPQSYLNEEDSAQYFIDAMAASNFSNTDVINSVCQIILDTKTHSPSSEISKYFCDLDLSILFDPFSVQMEFEHNIFKEFQFVDYHIYRQKRIEILTTLNAKPELIDYVATRKPNIGIYAGSFNPFHKGHYNVLQKAEAIFDKVIVAFGVNTDKPLRESWEVPSALTNHQTELYNTLLTDFIDSRGYPVTLIRGLRNATDLQYETTFYRYMQDQKPDIKVVSIICDAQYEHISSSGIKTVRAFNENLANSYLP